MVRQSASAPELEREIAQHILAFRQTHPCMMFSDLAEALPGYTWQMLFSALSRLCKQHHVELLVHRWDYEVIFLDHTAPGHSVSHAPHGNEERDHDERTHV